MGELKRCRSCQANIEWVATADGKQVPLDAKPLTVAIEIAAGIVEFRRARQSHFATCPNAAQHRKPRERRETRVSSYCAMCGKPCGPGVPGSAVVGGVVPCGRICLRAHRAKQAVQRRANKCD